MNRLSLMNGKWGCRSMLTGILFLLILVIAMVEVVRYGSCKEPGRSDCAGTGGRVNASLNDG